MEDDNKTREQLLIELTELRSQNAVQGKSITGSISDELATGEARRYAESIVETVRKPLLVLDEDLKVTSAKPQLLQKGMNVARLNFAHGTLRDLDLVDFGLQEGVDEILRSADGIMIARGDLGVQISIEDVPAAQKKIIHKTNLLSRPVITDTQMLLSLTDNIRPTGAEVSDVANSILEGTDAIMLSEETAIGRYPVEAVDRMIVSRQPPRGA
jgi:hypothetical protein